MKTRKKLSANGLLKRVKQSFEQVKEHRIGNVKITLADNLMSGFAMFSLALHAFGKRPITVSIR